MFQIKFFYILFRIFCTYILLINRQRSLYVYFYVHEVESDPIYERFSRYDRKIVECEVFLHS